MGSGGHDGNERCDALANEQIAKIKNTLTPDQLRAELDRFLARDGNGDDAGRVALSLCLVGM
jgi:hypothetical protein